MNFYDTDFDNLDKEDIKNILRRLYDEYSEDAEQAAAEFAADTRSASRRNFLRNRQLELRTMENIIENLGLNFWEY